MKTSITNIFERIESTTCQTSGIKNGRIETRMEGRISQDDFHELMVYVGRLEAGLRFYNNRNHWMPLAKDSEGLHTSLVAMQGDGEQHGWRVAEDTLAPQPKHGE